MEKDSENKGIFYKETFEKTTEARRNRIIDVAIKEFSENGYSAASINRIVEKSGISMGAMYSYFSSKEDLFLTIVNKGFELLKSVYEVDTEQEDLFAAYEKLLYDTRDYTRSYPELFQIYLDITSQSLSFMSARLSSQLEPVSVEFYHNVIEKTKKKGLIDDDLDESMIAFLLDNLVTMFMFSLSSDYYMQRMRFFLGEEMSGDAEEVIEGILRFVRRMLKKS